jgi:hypothetical protein
MLAPIDQNTGNNGYQETGNPILAHPGLRALLQQQIAIRDGVAPAGTPSPAMMPSSSAAGATAPPITPSLPDTPLSQQALPSSPQPHIVAPRGTVQGDEKARTDLLASKPALENVYGKITGSQWGQNHPGLGKLAGIAGQIPATAADLAMSLKGLPVLGNSLSSIGQVMPGTTEQHNAKLGEAEGAVTADEANREKEAQAQNLTSEVPLHAAQAGYYGAHAEAIGNHQVTPEEAAAMGNPDLAGSLMDPKAWEQLIKQHGINTTKEDTAKPIQGADGAMYRLDPNNPGVGIPLTTPDGKPIAGTPKPVDMKKQLQNGVVDALNKGNGPEAKRLMGQLEAIDPIGFQNAQSGAGRAGAMETQAGIAGNRFNADYYGIGPNGQPIPGAPMIDGQPVGFKGGLGATLTNRLAVANAVDAMKPQLMSSIDAAAKVGAIGPVGGRWTTFEQLAGDPDPEAQYLWGQMKSFTSLMPALHAMRSAELAQYLDKASGGLKQKPESLKAYFNGLGSITGSMSSGINATRYTTPKAGGNQPAQGGGMIRAINDKGVLHEAPKGTPLPKGWKAQ